MQVKEIISAEVNQCPYCFKKYAPRPGYLKKCSYCQREFKIIPEKIMQTVSNIKEKCENCSHTFKPRLNKDKPVCPRCHKAV